MTRGTLKVEDVEEPAWEIFSNTRQYFILRIGEYRLERDHVGRRDDSIGNGRVGAAEPV